MMTSHGDKEIVMPYGKPNKQQVTLFGEQEAWREEWVGMPEYEQENLLPNYSVKVNFATVDDLKRFAELIGQPLTTKTKSVWFPPQKKAELSKFVYVDVA
jgi:hypothetical protein